MFHISILMCNIWTGKQRLLQMDSGMYLLILIHEYVIYLLVRSAVRAM